MIKEVEIAVANAANRALKIHSRAPNLAIEEIIKKIIPFLEADKMGEKAKIAAIASINGVIKLKKQHRDLGDREIIERFFRENKASLTDMG